MQIAVKPRLVAGVASLGLLMASAAALPTPASAANITCKGHTDKGQDTVDLENALNYTFACTGRILGYMVLASRDLDSFDTEIQVTDGAGAIVGSDGFACEGDIPGRGVGCFGGYSTNNIVRGAASVADSPVCTEPRVDLQLVVVAETLDTATGAPKKTSLGATAGPFDLGRPHHCPTSSILGGLFAEIALRRSGKF